MIYTLTLNPALDKTVIIPDFRPGAVNRIRSLRTDIGGKGINVSKCLQALDCPSVAAGFFGGETGARAAHVLEHSGIPVLCIPVSGEMRTNLKVLDPEAGLTTDLNEPGPVITAEELQALTDSLSAALQPGDLLILSGSIPGGVPETIYRDLIELARQKGANAFLDADGSSLRTALDAAPLLIKPNRDELARLTGKPLDTPEQIVEAASPLLTAGIPNILVSLGADGAMLLRPDGVWLAKGLSVPVQSTVGAGDSMTAAMAFAMGNHEPPETQLRLAIAISAASVMQSGTQPPERSHIDSLIHQVSISTLF